MDGKRIRECLILDEGFWNEQNLKIEERKSRREAGRKFEIVGGEGGAEGQASGWRLL